eukprot:gene9621-10887_t
MPRCRTVMSLQDTLIQEKKLKRLFVCGLVFDYCVLDSCCNGKRCGFEEVY